MMNKTLKAEKKNNQLIINGNKIQSINKRELTDISERKIPGILNIVVQKETAPVCMSISTQGLTSLTEYLSGVVITKRLFAHMIGEIIKTIKQADLMKFSRSLFVYDTDYVFVNKAYQTVFLTYIPLQPCNPGGTLSNLLNQIVRKASFDSSDDLRYVSDFIEITKKDDFSMYILDEYLKYLMHETDDTDDENPFIDCPKCKSRIPHDAFSCEYCGFRIKKGSDFKTEADNTEENSYISVNEDASGLVTVFRAPAHKEYGLFDTKNGKVTEIVSFPFRIGKLLAASDMRIENEAVSRKHAEIVKDNGKYYIIDLYSKNGTFINGRLIQSGVKEPLQNNDEISFANSKFVFRQTGGNK